ncbi:MAG: response regulator transcription factor [Chloroflexi bacterium]|nr:response regulator transcription factor [Chloroflexota bacterium]
MTKEILIIEDEGFISGLLSRNLSQRGYEITAVKCKDALRQARKYQASLILFEVPTTGAKAFETCQLMRSVTTAPIIALIENPTQLGEIEGIQYLSKPVDFHQLLVIVENTLKSKPTPRRHKLRTLRDGDLVLDLRTRCLTKGDHTYHLTPKECLLLKLFMSNPGRVLSHKTILKKVWHTDYDGDIGTLQVHVSWLRKKIEDEPGKHLRLRTVRGVGYRFEASKPPERSR